MGDFRNRSAFCCENKKPLLQALGEEDVLEEPMRVVWIKAAILYLEPKAVGILLQRRPLLEKADRVEVLNQAIKMNNPEIVRILLDENGQLSPEERGELLKYAAEYGSTKIAQVLTEDGPIFTDDIDKANALSTKFHRMKSLFI